MTDLERRLVAVDCETGGFVAGKHALLSIGVYAMCERHGGMDAMWRVMRGDLVVEDDAAVVCGYTGDEDWRAQRGAVDKDAAMRGLAEWLKARAAMVGGPLVLVAHNAAFDLGFLTWAGEASQVDWRVNTRGPVRCSMAAMLALKDAGAWDGSASLDGLAECAGLRPRGRQWDHCPVEDAQMCWHGYTRLIRRMSMSRGHTGEPGRECGGAMRESLRREPRVPGEGGAV